MADSTEDQEEIWIRNPNNSVAPMAYMPYMYISHYTVRNEKFDVIRYKIDT